MDLVYLFVYISALALHWIPMELNTNEFFYNYKIADAYK